jgi:nucleoside-diphosphate-sugar epimerase
MMKALVTGGAGFIGSHIAEALVRIGWETRVMDDLSNGKKENLEPFFSEIEFISGSITDNTVVKKALEGTDYIFHEAALVSVVESVSNPEKTHEINVEGTRNVLEAALEAKVKRVVFASSAAIYGDANPPIKEDFEFNPLSPYAESKIEGEKLLKEFAEKGLETVSLRYFNVYGERQDPKSQYSSVITRFIERMLAGENPRIYGDGNQTRDFIYIDDVVNANIIAAEKEGINGNAFNIGTGIPVTINQLEGLLSELIGYEGEPEYTEKREGDIYESFADVSRAERILGFRASTPFEQGLRNTIEWQKSI